jgi:Uncharacterized protein conserved in bacteria
MNRRYFWHLPELKRFRAVFEDRETILGADAAGQHRFFRKDTGKICFDERQAARLCIAALIKDETAEHLSEKKSAEPRSKRITIIGSGASGTLLTVNLLRSAADQPLEINLIEKKKKIGRGLAYSTGSDCHLLNVPAENMGAFEEDPEHFYRWLIENEYDYKPKDFVPRRIYGSYLRDVLANAIAEKSSSVKINLIEDEAIDVKTGEDCAQVILKSGEILFSDRVVLAFGNFAPSDPPVENPSFTGAEKYFRNPWSEKIYEKIEPADDVLIIGTGLSMVDVVLSFHQRGHRGKIFAVSTHGLLPAVHRLGRDLPPFNGEITSQFKISGMMKTVREKIREQEAAGGDWRAVIDALRPVTQKAWLNIDETEKRRFVRHLGRIWNVSRHRMPAECAAVLDEMRVARRLHLKKGRVRAINLTEDGKLEVIFFQNGLKNKISVDAVINCTGSQTNFSKIDIPLVKNLLAGGLLTPDALNLGVKALPDGRVLNKFGGVSDKLFVIGSALKGVLWESTAIPEIRIQAGKTAAALLA